MGLIHEKKNSGRISRASVPLKSSQCKILSITKKTPGGKKDPISSYTTAKNMPKVTLSSCGLQKKLRLRSCCCGATFL
jgi:hypothetical protein